MKIFSLKGTLRVGRFRGRISPNDEEIKGWRNAEFVLTEPIEIPDVQGMRDKHCDEDLELRTFYAYFPVCKFAVKIMAKHEQHAANRVSKYISKTAIFSILVNPTGLRCVSTNTMLGLLKDLRPE